MEEYKQGSLSSSSGQRVTSRPQAIAIALSEQRAADERNKKKKKKKRRTY
jgi:hypothetical protein